MGLLRIGIRTDDSAFAFLEKIQLCRRNRRRCNGAAVDGLWLAFLSGSTGTYEIVPGFICSMAAAVIVSKLTAEPEKEVTDIFDTASNAAFDE